MQYRVIEIHLPPALWQSCSLDSHDDTNRPTLLSRKHLVHRENAPSSLFLRHVTKLQAVHSVADLWCNNNTCFSPIQGYIFSPALPARHLEKFRLLLSSLHSFQLSLSSNGYAQLIFSSEEEKNSAKSQIHRPDALHLVILLFTTEGKKAISSKSWIHQRGIQHFIFFSLFYDMHLF